MVQAIENCQDLVAQIDTLGVAATVKAHRKPPLMSRILRELYELYHDQDRYLAFLAHYPLIPSDLADQIASQLDPEKVEIASGLAGNPRCPQQALNRLVHHPAIVVRQALAANPNLTPKEFQAMVEDENTFVRAALAQNSSLPNPLQFLLADDPASAVRIALSTRKNLDLDVAIQLAQSQHSLVSAAVILNYTLDDELLQLWAEQDQAKQQLLLLKRQKSVPMTALQSLGFSPHGLVARTAFQLSGLNGPAMLYLSQSQDTRDRIFLAEQSDLPASIQRRLAQDSAERVRRRLAANHSIHESIALHIVASNDLGACRALAKNPATSDRALRALCQHPDDAIALLVAYRDDLQPEHLDLLINHRSSCCVVEHLAYQGISYLATSAEKTEQLTKHASPTVRAFAAQAANISAANRNQLMHDPSTQVRKQLALNPQLSEHQLRGLRNDSEREVVFAAESNFAARIRQQSQAEANAQPAVPVTSSATRKSALFNTITSFFSD